MNTRIFRAKDRGGADHGWLKTHHSFSFANWYDPDRTNFGLLRVLNDDRVEGGKGFGTHPHDNMEIVSIPLKGALEHRDSMGTEGIIRENDVQAMSAGKGILHSEYNHDPAEPVHFLQIWIFPKVRDVVPRYDQMHFDPALRQNKLQVMVAPVGEDIPAAKIHQDAYISRITSEPGRETEYLKHFPDNGVYLFVIEGTAETGGHELNRRDAAAVTDTPIFSVKAKTAADLLFIEVPMA